MKFTVAFVAILGVASCVAVAKDDTKDKREASPGYASSSGHSSGATSYVAQPLGHSDASAISVGAGYSIGGAKPSYYTASTPQFQQESGHSALQLAPITLKGGQGIIGTDLTQIMNQLSHSLNSGAITLQPSNTVAEFHESNHGQPQAQELSYPQYSFGAPKYQQYALGGASASAPSYNVGAKGLSSYGATGPVLFNPSDAQNNAEAAKYAAPGAGQTYQVLDVPSLSHGGSGAGQQFAGLSLGSGHGLSGPEVSLGTSGLSLSGLAHSLGSAGNSYGSGYTLGGGSLGGHSLGDSGHSLDGAGLSLGSAGQSFGGTVQSFGGAGHSLGGAGHSLGDSAYSLGGAHSLGGSGNSYIGAGHSLSGAGSPQGSFYKVVGGHGHVSKSAFKPSAFLGASVAGDNGHSGSHGIPSFGGSQSGLSLSSHGASFPSFSAPSGSSKHISSLYTKASGYPSFGDSASAYSSAGHLAYPAGSISYPGSSSSLHSASSGPHYYVSSKGPSFGEGSSSYKSSGPSHSSLSSPGHKYSIGSHGSSRYSSPKGGDSHGAYSENVYNTIKYSEELKPRA